MTPSMMKNAHPQMLQNRQQTGVIAGRKCGIIDETCCPTALNDLRVAEH
jgi:hypothetical protein